MRVRLMVVRDGRRRIQQVAIESPRNVYDLLKPEMRGLDREVLWAIHLNARNAVMHYEVVSIGTATASLVHPREVYRAAIAVGACGIVLAHFHPSGDPAPSSEDRAVTTRIKRAGEIIGVPLLDHVIVAHGGYFSFKELGPL